MQKDKQEKMPLRRRQNDNFDKDSDLSETHPNYEIFVGSALIDLEMVQEQADNVYKWAV